MAVSPEQASRRSYVYPRLVAAGAEFVAIADTVVAAGFPAAGEPPLGLIDLSPLPRIGIKGPQTTERMGTQGWPVPEHNNKAVTTDAGETICRLADQELLVLASPQGWMAEHRSPVDEIVEADGAWLVPRRDSHCWFALRGPDAASCLQKLCGIDLREQSFPPGSIAQTSIARLNGIVLRGFEPATPEFHILADSASATWFWDALLDAAEEFGGGPLGLRAQAPV